MKHSKLPWNLLSYPVAGQEEESCKIWTPDSSWSVASGLSLDNAQFIVTACNEHDTLKAEIGSCVMLNEALMEENTRLKAKEVLINELHDKVKTCCQVYSDAPLKFALEVTNITKDILSKAKEL